MQFSPRMILLPSATGLKPKYLVFFGKNDDFAIFV